MRHLDLVLAAGLIASAFSAHAATLTVNALDDPGSGNCASTCTLRDAIASAAPDDVITFASALNYPATITLFDQQLLVYKNLTIQGPGAKLLSINGSGSTPSRLFEIAANASVSVSGLRLEGGAAYGTHGGVDTQGNGLPGGPGSGGAFLVDAGSSLQILACVFRNNFASGGVGGNALAPVGIQGSGGPGQGGAIASAGTLLIANSTFTGNSAGGGYSGGLGPPFLGISGAAGGDAQGGAIYATGLTEVTNSQFLNNGAHGGYGGASAGAAGGNGGSAQGGALATSGFTVLAFVSAVLNRVDPGPGGLGTTGGSSGSGAGSDVYATATVLSRYSVLTSTSSGTVATCAMTSSMTQGANLDADWSCPNYSLQGDANLQIVITSDGAMFAFPRWGSPLIDAAADCADAFATTVSDDVRGGVRPLDGNADGVASCDLGAVESDELFANGFE